MKFLLRQGIALRGHTEEEGNLSQLLAVWSEDNANVKDWMKEGKFMSHDIVNELITLMGLKVLRQLLMKIKSSDPCWYAIMVDEATDVSGKEQCNLSIRYVDNDYVVSEDSVGLFSLSDTTAGTLAVVVKDMLICCALPLSLCRGQAYDGAANMQGKKKGQERCPSSSFGALLCTFVKSLLTRCWKAESTTERWDGHCQRNSEAN